MTSIQDLPSELLSTIFTLVRSTPYGTQGGGHARRLERATLLSASLVARAWREPAQSCLLAEVNLETLVKARPLLGSAAFERHTVKRLRLTTDKAMGDIAAAQMVLERVKGVRMLALSSFLFLDPALFADDRFRNVQDFRLSCSFFQAASPDDHPGPNWALRRFEFEGSRTPRLPSSILTSSTDILSYLKYHGWREYNFDPAPFLIDCLQAGQTSLRTLDLRLDLRALDAVAPYLGSLAQLKQLSFTTDLINLPQLAPLLDTFASQRLKLNSLRLQVAQGSREDVTLLLEGLTHWSATSLEKLSLCVTLWGTEAPWDDLGEECERRGIAVEVDLNCLRRL